MLVVGDVMLDAYYFGRVDRISPEAPVPVVNVSAKDRRGGGAANVAVNIHNLGAEVHICSIIGNDREGQYLKHIFERAGIHTDGLIMDPERQTTVKTRVIGNNQQILRVDEEDLDALGRNIEIKILDYVKSRLYETDVVVLQDYNKGVLSKYVIQRIISACQDADVPVVVDPKKENFFAYKGVTLFKPNRKELREGLKTDEDLQDKRSVEKALLELNEKIDAKQIMVTLSEDGTAIFSEGTTQFIPAHPRKVIDVSGAGDSVISVAALCVALNLSPAMTAELSNLAGGLVCEKVGVVPIDADLLLTEAVEVIP